MAVLNTLGDRLGQPALLGLAVGVHTRAIGAFHLAVTEQVDLRQQVALQQIDAAIRIAARPVIAVGEVEDVNVPELLRILFIDDFLAQLVRR